MIKKGSVLSNIKGDKIRLTKCPCGNVIESDSMVCVFCGRPTCWYSVK